MLRALAVLLINLQSVHRTEAGVALKIALSGPQRDFLQALFEKASASKNSCRGAQNWILVHACYGNFLANIKVRLLSLLMQIGMTYQLISTLKLAELHRKHEPLMPNSGFGDHVRH